jgi:CheY-like chemotaxis protein
MSPPQFTLRWKSPLLVGDNYWFEKAIASKSSLACDPAVDAPIKWENKYILAYRYGAKNNAPQEVFTGCKYDGDPHNIKVIPVWLFDNDVASPEQLLYEAGLSVPVALIYKIPDDKVICEARAERLLNHFRQLVCLYPDGLSFGVLRSIAMGVFRRNCCLDVDPHGASALDLRTIREASAPLATKVWENKKRGWDFLPERIIGNLSVISKSLLGKLFVSESKHIIGTCRSLVLLHPNPGGNPDPKKEKQATELGRKFNESIPRQGGEFQSLDHVGGKLHVLVIDDESRTVKELKKQVSGHFVFTHRHPHSLPEFRTWCSQQEEVKPGFFSQFDMALLDLSLGDAKKNEPEGYQYLPILRTYLPLVPIVVHSSYSDMGHIEMAYRHGANWYLPKSQSSKLGRHHAQLMRNSNWLREWKSIQSEADFDGDGEATSDPEVLYLLFSLLRHLPGKRIRIRTLTGGIGGAMTLLAQKQVMQRYDLVSPAVVKIDKPFDMILEQTRYLRWIAPYLGNQVGRIDRPIVKGGRNLCAIAYTYAGLPGGKERKTVTLKSMISDNLAGLDERVLPFRETYGEIFRRIYTNILPSLHGMNPRDEFSEQDYPNPLFGEFATPTGSYLARMPPDFEIELTSALRRPDESSGKNGQPSYYVLEPDADRGRFKALRREAGKMTRVDITDVGGLIASTNHLRPNQPFRLPADFNRDTHEKTVQNKVWQEYWAAGEKNLWDKEEAWLGSMRCDSAENLCDKLLGLKKYLMSNCMPVLKEGPIGIVHGDLNFGNIMVEQVRFKPVPASPDPWLIDFARTRRDWIVYDFTQLEQCVLFTFFDPAFFHSDVKDPITETINLLAGLAKAPWQMPFAAERSKKIDFLMQIIHLNREEADLAGVGDKEYLFSLGLQLLIVHKIAANAWRKAVKKNRNPELAGFRARMLLLYAFKVGEALGWKD